MERGCLAAIGAIIALVSAFLFTTALVESATGGDGKTSPGVYAGIIIVSGAMLLGGAFLVWRMVRKRSPSSASSDPLDDPIAARPTDADRERQTLQFAERERGRVTIPEVAANCAMTIFEAKAVLDRLVTLNAATMQITPGGVVVYTFPGFLSDEDKARAKDF